MPAPVHQHQEDLDDREDDEAGAAPAHRTAKPKRSLASERHQPTHAEICERAYFIHLEQRDSDELGDWLRAEQELAAA